MNSALALSNEILSRKIRQTGIRPSSARIHVLRYLEEERNHPTVDQIYKALLLRLPGLSRASVYNSLAALEGSRLVRPLTMDGNELRYDACVADHGHFRCLACGGIRDFELDLSSLRTEGLGGFAVERQDFLAWGFCPDCAETADAKTNTQADLTVL
ncbi:MAG: transcriptional repressor [Clostridiales Family XIII bacterium]|jgi:Fe2+ or Zn2+ uptake regulation protein|nr:transcriptional repressor [Clostridiales Family XIII bacterium]